MPKTVKHAWTHRPRSEGGTDPVEVAASPVPVCHAVFYDATFTDEGNHTFVWDELYRNDPIFSLADSNTAIEVSEAGVYWVHGSFYDSGAGAPAHERWLELDWYDGAFWNDDQALTEIPGGAKSWASPVSYIPSAVGTNQSGWNALWQAGVHNVATGFTSPRRFRMRYLAGISAPASVQGDAHLQLFRISTAPMTLVA